MRLARALNPRAIDENPFARIMDAVGRDGDDQIQRAVVHSANHREVYVIRDGQTARDERSYPRNRDLDLVPGDEVILLRARSGYVVAFAVTRNEVEDDTE